MCTRPHALQLSVQYDDALCLQNSDPGIQISYRTSGRVFNLHRLRAKTKITLALICELLYADDYAIVAHSDLDLQQLADSLSIATKRFGLTISIKKTEVLFQPARGSTASTPKIKIDGKILNCVDSITYLGSSLSSSNSLDKEISTSIAKANASYDFYDWTSWGSCSRSCGGGNQERQRIGTWILESRPCNKYNCPIDGGWSDWSKWTNCTKNVNGIQMRTRQCVNPKPQFGGKLCTGLNATAIRGCTTKSRCRQDFSVRLLTIKGVPSNGSLQILTNGTWKDLCITNWNEAERNLVCQALGYNGSSLGVCSNSGTNSSGNTTHSCEQLTQDCEEKISREIKCSVPVRLAGLHSINYAGRVEVFYQGKWGKICRNKWDINDVKVVCKQLGFQSVVAEFIGMDTKDENISVVMSNVACTGQESVLASCKRFDGKHNCVENKGAQAFCEPKNRTVLEKRHHVFNIGSTVTVKCSKVETKNISWHNGSTGVKIKSRGRIELNGLSLKITNFQLDDAGTYECRGESDTRFHTIYANGKLSLCAFCSSPQHYFHHHHYNAIFFLILNFVFLIF
ncbi:uncharacterized protein [Acropora muricata]|uniref:uncharacterized protein n=1 Tax=Acropora muricata TaxID=159855 RepID=UPI0034E5F152